MTEGGKLLRAGHGSLSRRGLRGGVRRVRYRARDRRREAEGHRLRRPAAVRDAGHDRTTWWASIGSAPGNFAQLAAAYRAKHGVSQDDLKRAMAHVSVKSHANGAKNPKAHLRKAD